MVNRVEIIMKESSNDDGNDIKLLFDNLDDFKNFNKPLQPGCLVKAALVFTNLVELDSKESLKEQLEKKIGGSLEIHTWLVNF